MYTAQTYLEQNSELVYHDEFVVYVHDIVNDDGITEIADEIYNMEIVESIKPTTYSDGHFCKFDVTLFKDKGVTSPEEMKIIENRFKAVIGVSSAFCIGELIELDPNAKRWGGTRTKTS